MNSWALKTLWFGYFTEGLDVISLRLGLKSFLWLGTAFQTLVILKAQLEDQDSLRFNPSEVLYTHTHTHRQIGVGAC